MTKLLLFTYCFGIHLVTLNCLALDISGDLHFEKDIPKAAVIYQDQDTYTSENMVVDQKLAQFDEFLYVTQPGATVEFMNTDSIRHNIFTQNLSIEMKFNAGILRSQNSVSKRVDWDSDSMSRLACYIHNTMEAYLAVIKSNRYTKLDFRVPVSLSNSSKGYRSRLARPIDKLQDRVIFTLKDVNKDQLLKLLIPYHPPLIFTLTGEEQQSFPVVLNGLSVGELKIQLQE